jgi:hypothetical protein
MHSLTNLPSISEIADVCGIVGLIFSIAIWRLTGKLKEQISIYKKSQKDILTNLKAQRDSIRLDHVYTISVRSELRTELYGMLQNFSAILTIKDRCVIRRTLHLLKAKSDSVNRESLCSNLDYIIARFQKKENLK